MHAARMERVRSGQAAGPASPPCPLQLARRCAAQLQQPTVAGRTRRAGRLHAPPQAAAVEDSASADDEDALLAQDISIRLGAGADAVHALRGATLRVRRGTLHMLLGPNGCGKSTLLRVCGGLLRPDSGRLRVASPRGFVFQNPDHQVVMPSAGADVAFGLGRLSLPAAEVKSRVDTALAAVGLQGYEQRPVHTLSGGQKQRVAIAGALAERPQVLLLDELTTFLDADDQRGVLDAVRAAVDGPQRVTALWVTHRLEELEFSDRASCMEDGAIVRTGTGAEMRRWVEEQAKR